VLSTAEANESALLQIQRLIVERDLTPGDRIGTEAELASQFALSRAAVREAVRVLSQANLVRAARGPGGGVFVTHTPERGLGATVSDAIGTMLSMGLTSLGELIEVRAIIEVPLAGLAARRADPAVLAALRAALDEAEQHPDDESVQRNTDQRFHRTIAEATGNAIACSLISWSSLVLQPALKDLIAPAIVEAVARDQHREILAAIEAGKQSVAERAMQDHLRYLTDLLETVTPPQG